MKKYIILSALLLGAASVPLVVMADDHGGKEGKKGGHFEKMFEKQDTDGNGEVSKDEFMKSAEARFAKMDMNGDGVITKEEAKEVGKKMREKWKEHKGPKDGDKPPPPPPEDE